MWGFKLDTHFPVREIWGGGELRSKRTLIPGAPARREVGSFLRDRIGVYLVRLVEGVEADMIARDRAKAEKLQAARDMMAQAFPAGRART